MKTKVSVYLLLAAMITSLLFTSCAKKKFDYYKEDLSKYVTLGEYKAITVDVDDIAEITDADVKKEVDALLKKHGEAIEIKDRAAAKGDTVNIDYLGKLDGVAFDGGTADDAELELGSNSFIAGFEDGIIGKTPSEETFDLNLTFPEDYRTTELAGKEVVFTVTLNYIYGTDLPEYTDAFVEEKTDYNTIQEYEKSIKDRLVAARDEQLSQNKLNTVWQKIVDNATTISLPQQRIDEYVDSVVKFYNEWAVYYEKTYEEFIAEYLNTTEAELLESAKKEAETAIKQELVFYAIVKAEGYSVTEEEYNAGVDKFVVQLEFKSKEELLAKYSEEEIRDALLWEKVANDLAEKATIKWIEPETEENED